MDASLESLDILTQYTYRWAIEFFFRGYKACLGFNRYQVRSEKGVNRYLLLIIIAYTYCKLYSNESYHFNTEFKLAQKELKRAKVTQVYHATVNGEPIEKIFELLKID